MNCPNCGQTLDAGAVFCGNCGQAIASVSMPPTPVAPVAFSQPVMQQQPAAIVPDQIQPQVVEPVIGAQITPSVTQPTVMPTQQVLQNPAPAASFSMPSPGFAPPAFATSGSVPAYAMPGQIPTHQKGEVRAIIGLIIAVLALPATLIPILGLALGITGIVLGSLSLHTKKVLGILAMIFGILAVLISLALWGYLISKDQSLKHGTTTTSSNSSSSLSGSLQSVDTPCYSLQMSAALHVATTAGSCAIKAMDGDTAAASTIVYDIESFAEPSLNSTNFNKSIEAAVPTLLSGASSSTRTYTLTDQHGGSFAGEQAYFVTANSNQNTTLSTVSVLHSASNGDNFFTVAVGGTGSVDISGIESSFNWK
jgi:hypothetical protein